MKFVITVSKGLEEVVASELRAIGMTRFSWSPGVVTADGGFRDICRANLHLRTARRVLWPVASFDVRSPDDLYDGARAADWRPFLAVERTFAVEASVWNSCIGHSGFAALKVKDAIADHFREKVGARPDVDREDPDLRVIAHIEGRHCTLSADSSGGPLHKRGYRQKPVVGALNETLAAGIVLLSGYDGSAAFCDPMCGSGTFLVEAALVAARVAPGLVRKKPFGFERWPLFERGAWLSERDAAESAVVKPANPIVGADISPAAVSATQANAKAVGVSSYMKIVRCPVQDFDPPQSPGVICANPPYGEHLGEGEDLVPLYKSIGDMLKRRAPGYRAFVLCGNVPLGKMVGLRPSRKIKLYNGPAECRLLCFDLWEGSKRGGGTTSSAPE